LTGPVKPTMRIAAVLVGLLGLGLVVAGPVALVQAAMTTQSMAQGLVLGPVVMLVGLPAVIAAARLWRHGQGWWLAASWTGTGLLIGIYLVWQEATTRPSGASPGLALVTLGFAAGFVALLIARVR
jgi:hypothetical protein